MADNTSQFVEIWGSVQYKDRPENHKKVGENQSLVHSMAVKSAATGKTIYVSFWENSFPGWQHPEQNTPVFIAGRMKPGGDPKYTNVTADAYSVFPVIKAIPKDSGGSQSF